jgi:glycosyltransferase involved in cell wall biosynthesis
VPLVFSFHGLGDLSGMPRRRRIAFRLLPRLTTYLFTLSEASRRMLIAEYGWPEGCGVIPNGVDTDRFRPRPPHPGRSRLAIGTVGNLRPIKNHGLLVRACADLGRAGIDWELRIAGAGPEHESLTRLAAELGIAERVCLVGFVEDVPGFLQDLDIFALTSDSEQHPNGLTEAMACGLPCVATRDGGVPELLDGGQCGRIVAPRDQAGVAEALRELAESPPLRRCLGGAARSRAVERYSMTAMLDAYEALYRRLSQRRDG